MGDAPVVLDPVMVAESGAHLLADDARDVLRERLLPLVDVVTPNLAEAEVLAGAPRGARGAGARDPCARPEGGRRDRRPSRRATDVFFDGEQLEEIPGERYEDGAAHGSGCTHSSALAAYLAHGDEPLEAARKAKEIASKAVRNGLRDIGAGRGAG